MTSPDDTRIVPPAAIPTITDAAGVVWCIGYGGWVQRNGVNTTGHSLQVLWHGGAIYALSPTNGHWWKYLGPNSWRDVGAADPAAAPQRRGYFSWARLLVPGIKGAAQTGNAIAANLAESASAAALFIGTILPAVGPARRVYLSWTELTLP